MYNIWMWPLWGNVISSVAFNPNATVEVAHEGSHTIGESPHWSRADNALYYVDIPNRSVHKHDPATGTTTSTTLEGTPSASFVIPVKDIPNSFLVGTNNSVSILVWDGTNGRPSTVAPFATVKHDPAGYSLNDGKCDPSGRLWTGTFSPNMLNETKPLAHLYSLEHFQKRVLFPRSKNIILSNGLAWNGDASFMYQVDSVRNSIYAYRFNVHNGKAFGRHILFSLKNRNATEFPGFLDGLCIDDKGFLWVANFGGSQLIRINPHNGHINYRLRLPVPAVTSCTFGGPNLDTMYITTARFGVNVTEFPQSGALFRATNLGVRGLRSDVSAKF